MTALPPSQQLVAPGKWPLVGQREPRADDSPWTVTIAGAVEQPRVWSLLELRARPQHHSRVDIHCVTRWSKLDAEFAGILLASLLAEARPTSAARYVSFVARSAGSHHTSLPLAEALRLETMLALTAFGAPLESEHGGPARVVVPGRYFYKSLKWLERIELLSADRLGTWESGAGYHNEADPWREQRYMAPSLTKQQAATVLATRDFSGQDLRGLDARGRVLSSLKASGALLRDADFRGCDLQEADFTGANLSNARLAMADLRGAKFINADLEGASFEGADLRGADLRGVSLTAATFCEPRLDEAIVNPARFDQSTHLVGQNLDTLAPLQQRFLRAALRR